MTPSAFPARVQSCDVVERHEQDETSERVLELALYWHGDLLSVRHVQPSRGPWFADLGVPCIALPQCNGTSTETRAGALTLRATLVHASRRVARPGVDLRSWASTLFAACAHALVLGAMSWNAPASAGPTANVTVEDLDLMRSYLASSETVTHVPKDGFESGHGDEASGAPGGTGVRASGDEGRMGLSSSRRKDAHYAAAGRSVEGDRQDERPVSLDDARAFGMISLLGGTDAGGGGDFAWAGSSHEANGAMWGSVVGDALGSGGLGLTGVGQGGGGGGAGIGLGTIGTIGRGAGRGRGEDFGPGGASGTCDDTCTGGTMGHGYGTGTVRGRAHAIVCHLPIEEARVTGRLPPEAIQRVVRQSYGRFRYCYEQGLARSPALSGRVATKFVIARDGSVSAAADAGSDLPDANVVACVQRTFGNLSFPEPPGGVVSVVYPITFSPD